MREPNLRPATKVDVIAIRGESFRESFRGIVADLDGEVLAIAGVLHTSPLQAFSIMQEKMRKYPKTIVRAINEFKKVLINYSDPIIAFPSNAENNARKVLERAGFEPLTDEVYRWQSQQH